MRGGYGKADILNGCDLIVDPGQIAVIVGPNGAGKSTAMKAVFGMVNLREGVVLLDGQDIGALSPQDRVRRGMGFVPQLGNVFPTMTVEENLEMGAFIRNDDFRATLEQVYHLFPAIAGKRRQNAGELSGGQRQQVAVGRALMTGPRLLMLDEPIAGMSARERELTAELLQRICKNRAVIVIEHDMDFVARIAHKVTVMHQGKILAEGPMEKVQADARVIDVYLGH